MANIKFERLFSRGERAVIVAMDHGEFAGPLPGMEDLRRTAAKIAPCVDGILLSPAMLPHCRAAFNYKGAPLAVVRLNWSTVYCYQWAYKEAATVPAFSPAEALRLGGEIALISLTLETGSEAVDARNVEIFRQLCRAAKELGMPVIGEYYPADADNLSADEMHAKVYACARIIAELGADLIKTFYTKNFKEVTRCCPVPILGLGAARCDTQIEALQLAYNQVRDGAGGVVFGRNALQVADPAAFQRALCDVVKYGVKPQAAARKHGLKN